MLQGRTGTMICAYLLYKRVFQSGEQALEFFYSKRMLPGYRAVFHKILFGPVAIFITMASFVYE